MITQRKIKPDLEVPALRPGLPWLTSNLAPRTEGASYLPSATAQSHQRDRSPTETKIEKKPDLYRDRETSSRYAFSLNLFCIYNYKIIGKYHVILVMSGPGGIVGLPQPHPEMKEKD